MNRLLVVCGILLILAVGAAGQNTDDNNLDDDDPDPRPGLITADSPLYRLDVAADNAVVSLSMVASTAPVLNRLADGNRAADIVHERASEAVVAAEATDTAAAERVVEEAARFAQISHGLNGDSLQQADQILREVRDRVPEDAHQGIDTAIEQVMQARERMPTDLLGNPEIPDRSAVGGPDAAPRAGGE